MRNPTIKFRRGIFFLGNSGENFNNGIINLKQKYICGSRKTNSNDPNEQIL